MCVGMVLFKCSPVAPQLRIGVISTNGVGFQSGQCFYARNRARGASGLHSANPTSFAAIGLDGKNLEWWLSVRLRVRLSECGMFLTLIRISLNDRLSVR